jgi:EAL domain-containing protein (putative c-di-GMP-specific phosphodiesterase class I)
MLQFAKDTNALIVAEGVETDGEFKTLQKMKVDLMQGYFLGRPTKHDDAVALCARGTPKNGPN